MDIVSSWRGTITIVWTLTHYPFLEKGIRQCRGPIWAWAKYYQSGIEDIRDILKGLSGKPLRQGRSCRIPSSERIPVLIGKSVAVKPLLWLSWPDIRFVLSNEYSASGIQTWLAQITHIVIDSFGRFWDHVLINLKWLPLVNFCDCLLKRGQPFPWSL